MYGCFQFELFLDPVVISFDRDPGIPGIPGIPHVGSMDRRIMINNTNIQQVPKGIVIFRRFVFIRSYDLRYRDRIVWDLYDYDTIAMIIPYSNHMI